LKPRHVHLKFPKFPDPVKIGATEVGDKPVHKPVPVLVCNFFSPNFRNSCTVNSNTKRPDSIKGSNKTMGN
jgi:hypothetical protein